MKQSPAIVALVVAATLLGGVVANGKRRRPPTKEACPGGRFLNDEPIVGDDSSTDNRAIQITPTARRRASVTIPSCKPVRAALKVKRRRTMVNSDRARCSGLEGGAELVGSIRRPDCDYLDAKILSGGTPLGLRTVRASLSRCGDGIVDRRCGEQCEGGRGCDSSCRGDFGGTGAFGIVTLNGLQKMYLPLPEPYRNSSGNGIIAVVDVGLSGNGKTGVPALIRDIDLGTPDIATATGGNADVVVATSTESLTVWFINPQTDMVVSRLVLPADLEKGDFSGGDGIVTGVALDSAARHAVLSVWNGFLLVDLSTQTIMRSIVAAPSENFGYDAITRRIIAPFYNCPSIICDRYRTRDGTGKIIEGLNIIELADDTTSDDVIYTVLDQDADPSSTPTTPLGAQPDSAAADPLLNAIVVAPEVGPVRVLDLKQATFDRTAGTAIAPRRLADPRPEVPRLTGVAVERTQHYAFLEEEFIRDSTNPPEWEGNGVGVLKLDTFLEGRSSLVVAKMPSRPDDREWKNMGDPHGVAVTTGLARDRAVGFLVEEERRWVARIDLETFASGAQNLDAALTFLDARTPGTFSSTVPCPDM